MRAERGFFLKGGTQSQKGGDSVTEGGLTSPRKGGTDL